MGIKTILPRIGKFFGELKRRRVFRVAAGYAVVAWIFIEVASVILPAFSSPDWILRAFIIVAAAGSIAALIIAWIYDLTQEGFVRTQPLLTDDAPDEEDASEAPADESHAKTQAERRPVTVLRFKVDSAAAEQTEAGAEGFYELLPRVHEVFNSVIRRYDGYQTDISAGEANVFFGIPIAQEQDASRALRCALSMRDAIANLNDKGKLASADCLRFAAGLDSGTVVAGGAPKEAVAVVGPPLRGAQRLLARARPDELLASARTLELGGARFNATALTDPGHRRDDNSETVYKVLSLAGAARSSAVSDTRTSTPLVGRETELALLDSRCRRAFSGEGQVVLISGEPGIGKSRLTGELAKIAAGYPGVWAFEIACQSRRRGEAWHPIKQLLRKTVLFDVDDNDAAGMQERLEGFIAQHAFDTAIILPLLCDLLDIPTELSVRDLDISPERQNQQLFEFLLNALLHRAGAQPVLLIGEDVHWSDPTTLAFLHAAARQVPSLPMLIAVTYRNGFDPDFKAAGHISSINLTHLSQEEIRILIDRLSGDCDAARLLSPQIFSKSDGIPLFAEELARTVIAENAEGKISGTVASGGASPLPATLQESLMWRLDQFGSARAAMRVASALGRDFDFATLAEAGEFTSKEALLADLDRLIDGELLLQRGFGPQATYRFRHALLQDAAYGSLLHKDRKTLHDRIATVLPALHPRIKDDEPELLAFHLERGSRPFDAAVYWDLAGQREARRCSNREAVSNFERALACLEAGAGQPANDQQTLAILMRLGPAMMALRGYSAGEVEELYNRVRQLSESVEEPASLAAALFGQWAYQVVRGNNPLAADRAERLLTIAGSVHNEELAMEAHQALGVTWFHAGDLEKSHTHLRAVIDVYDPVRHAEHAYLFGQDPGVASYAYLANALWCKGQPEQALRASEEAIRLAEKINHPHSHAFALAFVARFHQHRGDREQTLQFAERARALCEKNILPVWDAFARMLCGWAKAMPGDCAEALDLLGSGLGICSQIGVGISVPYYTALLGQAQALNGNTEQAIATLEQAIDAASQAGGTIELPEIMRISARTLAQQDPANPAIDVALRDAMQLAVAQGAWGWQLRIANELAERLVASSQDNAAAALLRGALEKCAYRQAETDHQIAGELIARCAA